MRLDPLFPIWSIAIVSLVVGSYLLWQEWKKPIRFRISRTVAALIMITALIAILVKPKYSTEKSDAIILLTPNYSDAQVDSLVRKNSQLSILHWENTKAYKSSKILSGHAMEDLDQNIHYVLGDGLPYYCLDMMNENKYKFITASPTTGITDLSIKPVNFIHRQNTVTGIYNNQQKNTWIFLSGPAGNEDSVLLANTGPNNFELSFIPKREGKYLFDLIVQDSLDSIHERVPINVAGPKPLKILFLNRYPTFETQFLKKFLQRNKNSLILRYQISKNKFRFEYVNQTPTSFTRLTKDLLETVDLLIADTESLSNLSSLESEVLNQSIISGLGLLHLSADSKQKPSEFFPFKNLPAKSDTAQIQIDGKSYVFPIQSQIEKYAALVPVQKNKRGVMAGYTFRGTGKIGFQCLQETYQLSLSGDSTAYSKLWTPLLERVSRAQVDNSKISIVTPFPWYENEPIDVQVISSSENITLHNDGITLPLKEHLTIDNVWHARTWGGQPGWHTLTTEDDTLQYYVSDSIAWSSLALINKRRANVMASATRSLNFLKDQTWRDVPVWIFYLMFLLGAGYVWVAAKL